VEGKGESEAWIEARRNREPFYIVSARNAVPEVNRANPVIAKQAVAANEQFSVTNGVD
jgi:hypothetical protein